MRFAFSGQGKSGSARVVYVDFAVYKKVYLIYTYPKNERDNLTMEQRNEIKKMIGGIETALRREKGR